MGGINFMDKRKLTEGLAKVLEEKGKRNFKQSVELIVSMRSIDFSKTENRLNLDIVLPKGKGGKEPKIAVIAEEEIAAKAKRAGAELTIAPNELATYAQPSKLKELAFYYILLAQPNLMGQVAKNLGQYLGPRGKLPRPIIGEVGELMDRTKRSVRIVSKGKYMPTAQSLVGTEIMSQEDLLDNIDAVYEAIKSRVSEGNIKGVFLKLTMGKPVRVM